MLCAKVVVVYALCAFAFVSGMPEDADKPEGAAGLPLIQFTNGGIRLNFGGYHAQAGLGGLLSGSRTGGGLHASVGTPWGAHAGAGLGGLLGGDTANAGGGLYARAGLGNGRHEAAAGLGGRLDGSGRSGPGISGGLYAGAGNRGFGISTGMGDLGPPPPPPPPPYDAPIEATKIKVPSDEEKPAKGRTNIQVIMRSEKKPAKDKQEPGETSETKESPKPAEPPANKEVRDTQFFGVPGFEAGLFGDVSLNPAEEAPISIEKVKLISGAIEAAPRVPVLPNEANEITDNRLHRVRLHRPVVRKRLWGPRKQVIFEVAPTVEAQEAAASNIQKRQATYYHADIKPSQPNKVPQQQSNPGGTYFDDIFKIPIATLGAVNQLLNNNAG